VACVLSACSLITPSCKHLQASASVCVSSVLSVCQVCVQWVCLQCVSYPSGEPLEVKLGMDEWRQKANYLLSVLRRYHKPSTFNKRISAWAHARARAHTQASEWEGESEKVRDAWAIARPTRSEHRRHLRCNLFLFFFLVLSCNLAHSRALSMHALTCGPRMSLSYHTHTQRERERERERDRWSMKESFIAFQERFFSSCKMLFLRTCACMHRVWHVCTVSVREWCRVTLCVSAATCMCICMWHCAWVLPRPAYPGTYTHSHTYTHTHTSSIDMSNNDGGQWSIINLWSKMAL
jgi:hypothetical protein